MMYALIQTDKVEYSRKFQGLCKKEYHGHPNGCPNFGNQERCPPGLPLINDILDFSKDLYVIYTAFNVKEFADRMKNIHPEWKDQPRQLYNPRRWQPTIRKKHRKDIEEFLKKFPDYFAIKTPEAHGVNVSKLMENIGIKLGWEWPPVNYEYVYNVSVAGMKKT